MYEGKIEMTISLNSENFEHEVLNSNQIVLVDFWAPWCPPCRALGPIIDELANALAGQAKVGKLNVDESGDIAAKYGVSTIPTVLIFDNGKVVDTIVGLNDKATYQRALAGVQV